MHYLYEIGTGLLSGILLTPVYIAGAMWLFSLLDRADPQNRTIPVIGGVLVGLLPAVLILLFHSK